MQRRKISRNYFINPNPSHHKAITVGREEMKIKEGFNGKETRIRIYGKKDDRIAELWIEQTGLSEKETLTYMSVNELLDLQHEIKIAVKEIMNLD
jgi:hypothetical protein